MKDFIKKKAVVVVDENGLPNYMTMFCMEPGTYKEEEVPELFKIKDKIVPAVLISQFTNTEIDDKPASLPYQNPKHHISYNDAVWRCKQKGKGWHLMTNTEFVYLLHEAEELDHKIGGNTGNGYNYRNKREKGMEDGYMYHSTMTGFDPLTWSHDGTADGVFGLCGNFWEWVAGLRLHKGMIEYAPNNDAAVDDCEEPSNWVVAEVNDKPLKLYGGKVGHAVLSIAKEIKENNGGGHIKKLQLEELEEVPEIAYKLGIVPHKWKHEYAGLWANNQLEESIPLRGSSFLSETYGGADGLCFQYTRCHDADIDVSFRSALFLEDWKSVAKLLKTDEAPRIWKPTF